MIDADHQSMASRLISLFGWFGQSRDEEDHHFIALPGTSVSINCPQGYQLSNNIAGIEDLKSGASFVVTELPEEASDHIMEIFASQGANATAFYDEGLFINSTMTIERAKKDHKIFCGQQEINGETYHKWLSAYCGTKAVVLSFQSPFGSDFDIERIKQVFVSLEIGPPPSLETLIERLPYRFTDLAGFRITHIYHETNAILTIGEKDQDPDGLQPFVLVSPSLKKEAIKSNLEAHGRAVLKATEGFDDIHFIDGSEILFAGRRAFFLRAEAHQQTHGKSVRLFQVIRYEDRGYLRILGYTRQEDATKIGPKIGTLIHGMSFPQTGKTPLNGTG